MGLGMLNVIESSNVIEMPANEQSLIDLEFSDTGRDPRFTSGWWILPVAFVAFALIGIAAATAIRWAI